jgi:hypothetical protein
LWKFFSALIDLNNTYESSLNIPGTWGQQQYARRRLTKSPRDGAVGACGAGMDDLERAFCVPAPGVVLPNLALRAAYDRLEAELGRTLLREA